MITQNLHVTIRGAQGAGKTTLLEKISEMCDAMGVAVVAKEGARAGDTVKDTSLEHAGPVVFITTEMR